METTTSQESSSDSRLDTELDHESEHAKRPRIYVPSMPDILVWAPDDEDGMNVEPYCAFSSRSSLPYAEDSDDEQISFDFQPLNSLDTTGSLISARRHPVQSDSNETSDQDVIEWTREILQSPTLSSPAVDGGSKSFILRAAKFILSLAFPKKAKSSESPIDSSSNFVASARAQDIPRPDRPPAMRSRSETITRRFTLGWKSSGASEQGSRIEKLNHRRNNRSSLFMLPGRNRSATVLSMCADTQSRFPGMPSGSNFQSVSDPGPTSGRAASRPMLQRMGTSPAALNNNAPTMAMGASTFVSRNAKSTISLNSDSDEEQDITYSLESSAMSSPVESSTVRTPIDDITHPASFPLTSDSKLLPLPQFESLTLQ